MPSESRKKCREILVNLSTRHKLTLYGKFTLISDTDLYPLKLTTVGFLNESKAKCWRKLEALAAIPALDLLPRVQGLNLKKGLEINLELSLLFLCSPGHESKAMCWRKLEALRNDSYFNAAKFCI
jgi:hypothetical protein